MNYRRFVPFLLVISAWSLSAQSNVAVLDAVLGDGVPINASAIVADTINEQFVDSPDYTAVDRTNISDLQEEKSYQLSGDVKEEDIKELGTTFGADYICIPYVGLLGSTYSVSARLIDVETAKIVVQDSHRMQGEIDVLFTVAEIVGAELVGADLAMAVPVALEEAVPVPEVEEEEPLIMDDPYAGYEDSSSKNGSSDGVISDPRIHFVLSWMFPGYSGDDDGATNGYKIYEQDQFQLASGATSSENSHIGIDFHMFFPVWKYLYVGGGLTYTQQNLQAEDAFGIYSWVNFFTVEPYISVGGVVAFFDIFQVYGGVSFGGLIFTAGSEYGDDATNPWWAPYDGDMAIGFSIGFELGVTAYWKVFALDMRYKWSGSGNMVGDEFFFSDAWVDAGNDASFGHHGLTLGIGFAF